MTDRVLDISEQAARLSIHTGLLRVELENGGLLEIPCEELAAVVLGNRRVVLTQPVLSELAKAGAVLVTCDERFIPVSMLLPLNHHHLQSARFRMQAAMSRPTKKRLWRSIIRAKIRTQACALEWLWRSDFGLNALAARVRVGDPDNVEARAARRYWCVVFGDADFVRGNDDDARNHMLNYGYAILRAMAARAVCGCGLHPSFGVFHTNASNAFALADDLMEPFRPAVDIAVAADHGNELTIPAKRRILGALLSRYTTSDEERSLPNILLQVAQSFASVVMGTTEDLSIPQIVFSRALEGSS